MKIEINAKNKSIPNGTSFELPSFCILTGINGSGKSHLLEAIAKIDTTSVLIENQKIHNITYIGYNGLNPQINDTADAAQIINSINNFWGTIQGAINTYNNYLSQGTHFNDQTFITNFLRHNVPNKSIASAIIRLIKTTGKNFEDLKQDDISTDLSFAHANNDQLFFSQTALIFKAYHTRLVKNEIAEYRSKKHGKVIPFLTADEFTTRFGPPPWELINEILYRAGLPYQATNPEGDDHELPYHLKLIDPENAVEISVNDLSSGEKVLMSLALAIYNTGIGGVKPDLLLLDEPDAPLHPRFSKLLIEIILETIVKKANVNVIITSHSPSTVAMAPDGSVFEIEKNTKIPRLVSNAYAVGLLMDGVNYLRVSYETRKQIFVESRYDVIYFQRLHLLLSRKYSFNYEPVFLEPHSGSSNCSDVISIVKKLRESGSDLACGIIDFDGHNVQDNSITVLGSGSRYAIENYILDPLYIALTLVRSGKKSFSDFGVHHKATYMDITRITEAECQLIVQNCLSHIGIEFVDLATSSYENGYNICYPKEFLFHQGHQYEEKVIAAFPELNAVIRGRGDAALKLAIIQVIEELPRFLPQEFAKSLIDLLGLKS